ncbi:cationic peptide transport system ATP-binding protein [Pasteurella langaaensis DSM 22999]|uniref:Cationic peptide transport system ATP-binding protein n=1 Tax=Alitibacter langaaensis DSM 22999 TaxID=1122935 RepID=A0A2U0SK32_9PAST|nr:ATP-binding cassette domain-containing protein [Pasteurella langaaensis]PVX31693.1 cationic peptide transport system ATP-binding protein [Pasteurella langaaensis DSM 22999]
MTALLQVEDLTKRFKDSAGLFGQSDLYAAQDISFTLETKKTLAIIGNNGSGKSTVAKMIVGITQPTSGKIMFKGNELTFGDYHFRTKHIRMLFQDVNAAFNPRLNVGQILDIPLRLATDLDETERNNRIFDTLRLVGLYPDHTNIKIATMSTSQKQRVALAHALILHPDIIIADDALGFLDASVKTQLTNLMLDIQERRGVSYIYIGQNMGLIKHIADEVLVMDEGQMIEYGSTRSLFTNPQTDITRRLVEGYFGKVLGDDSWTIAK